MNPRVRTFIYGHTGTATAPLHRHVLMFLPAYVVRVFGFPRLLCEPSPFFSLTTRFRLINVENGEYSPPKEAGLIQKLTHLLGYKPEHTYLDIRFEDGEYPYLGAKKEDNGVMGWCIKEQNFSNNIVKRMSKIFLWSKMETEISKHIY